MRRLLLDVPREALAQFDEMPNLHACESFRVVHQFRLDRAKFAGICEVKCALKKCGPPCLVGHAGITKAETLSKLEDGTFLAYFEGHPNSDWAGLISCVGAHLYPPFELTPEAWRVNVLGTSRQVDRFLSRLRSMHLEFHIRSVGEATFPEPSALSHLTRQQRDVLSAAHRLGYYGVPRRADSRQVARALRLSKSTTVEHLRKAEKRIMDDLLAS